MNIKRLVLAFLAVFVFIFAFEWVFHGILLKDAYAQTMSLWRPENEMMGYFHWLVLGQAIIAVAFVFLFAQGFTGRGVAGGVALGIIVAVLRVGLNLITYAVQPLSVKIVVSWSIGGFLEAAVAGAIAGAIYKQTQAPAQANL